MFGINLSSNNDIIIDEELNEFLNKLKVDYNQFYRGVVVDNLDPENKGRVKVRIPQIYGTNTKSDNFISTNAIPWAVCAISPAGNDSGTYLPPNIGDTVFVAFESGLPTSPIYFGGVFTTRKDDTIEDKGISSAKVFNDEIIPVVTDDIPLEVSKGTERIIYKSLKGAVIYIDDSDGAECLRITDQSGQSIIMENLSLETLGRRGLDTGKNPKSQIVLTNSAGDSITLSQGKIHLKSANVIIETDNFKQIGLEEYADEENVADIILGKEVSTVTLEYKDMRTAENLIGVSTKVYSIVDETETLIAEYTNIDKEYLELELKSGDYRIYSTYQGYYDSSLNITVIDETSQTIQVLMSKETTEDNIQIVLTWNDAISDMDSHTKIYNSSGTLLEHVSYSNRDYMDGDINVVNLDVDDTDYFGPETTTINKSFNNKYLYYIHRFTSGLDITTSRANVKVFDKGNLIQDISIPTDTSYSDDYMFWKVLVYDCSNNSFEVINTITSSEPSL